MVTLAGLDTTNKRFTNYSVRKTTVMKLKRQVLQMTRIVSITGHKNEQSLRDYAGVDMEDHAKLSEILVGAHVLKTSTLRHNKYWYISCSEWAWTKHS